ncbi:hypothetical protein ACWGIR_22915 [Streptomyces albidoflavus]
MTPRTDQNLRACGCPYCKAKQPALAPARPAADPIQLPSEPRPIRVHTPGQPPRDHTLHPDGTLTTVLAGRPYRNFMSLAAMQETNWRDSHIELDPAPLATADGGGGAPADTSVQDALPLGDNQ